MPAKILFYFLIFNLILASIPCIYCWYFWIYLLFFNGLGSAELMFPGFLLIFLFLISCCCGCLLACSILLLKKRNEFSIMLLIGSLVSFLLNTSIANNKKKYEFYFKNFFTFISKASFEKLKLNKIFKFRKKRVSLYFVTLDRKK